MKKILLISTLSLGLLSFTGSEVEIVTDQTTVYVCNGASSKKYHFTKNCRGLKNCSTSLEATTIDDAKKRGRTLCGWED